MKTIPFPASNRLRTLAPSTRRAFLLRSLAFGGTAAMAGTLGTGRRVLAAEDGVLRARLYNDINRLDPAIYENAYNVDVMNCLYQKLITYAPNSGGWDWQLEAAEEMEQLDDTHIRFRLREGIEFSGGWGEMTAEDVKFSFERVIDPEIDSPVAGDFGPLEGVDVEDRYTGVIVLSEPFQPLWTIGLPYGVGHIVSKDAVESGGEPTFGMSPPDAYSGPFRLREWRTNEVTILERNDAWTGPEPAFHEIRLYPIPDEQSGEIAFEAGDIDFTQPSAASLERYQNNPPDDAEIDVYPSLFYVWLGMNLENPKLQDVRVRQAVQYAISVPAILDAAYFGMAEPATGIIAPGFPGYREQPLIPLDGDIDRARALLEEADAVGLELTLDVRNTATFSTAAQVMQSFLNRAGFNVEVRLLDSGVFWTLGSEAEGDQWQDIELILNRFSSTPDPFYATQWFTTDQVGRWNWERFSNEEYDRLHEEAVRETDPDARAEMYRRMQDIMEESGAYRFITHEVNPIMYRPSIVPAVRPDGVPLFPYFDQAQV